MFSARNHKGISFSAVEQFRVTVPPSLNTTTVSGTMQAPRESKTPRQNVVRENTMLFYPGILHPTCALHVQGVELKITAHSMLYSIYNWFN
eukprot:m.314729 g.314729  ORF g.314729 m.314729 type:complete len:91 (+) comp578448_c0_seq1:183-455(+)